jgi:hypothetical protein
MPYKGACEFFKLSLIERAGQIANVHYTVSSLMRQRALLFVGRWSWIVAKAIVSGRWIAAGWRKIVHWKKSKSNDVCIYSWT